MKILLSTLCLFGLLNLNISADEKLSFSILTPSAIKTLLGDFPKAGSMEEKKDYETILKYQDTRSSDECALADAENSATLKSIFGGANGPLTDAEASKLEAGLLKYYAEAGANIWLAKRTYKRPRPYDANPEIKPCIELETSYAYPSGHTTFARVFAHLLSAIYPERTKAFFEKADLSAEYRVLGGVHHPSDIVSGKKLADALFELMKKEKDFRKDIQSLR